MNMDPGQRKGMRRSPGSIQEMNSVKRDTLALSKFKLHLQQDINMVLSV